MTAGDWIDRRECPIVGCGHSFDAHEERCTVDGCRCLIRRDDLEPRRPTPEEFEALKRSLTKR